MTNPPCPTPAFQTFGLWWDIIARLDEHYSTFKSSYPEVTIYSFSNTYRNHNTTHKLGMYLGNLEYFMYKTFNVMPKIVRINETLAFYKVIQPKSGLKYNREMKKKLTLDFYNYENDCLTYNDDVADAYMLKCYVERYLDKQTL